MGSLDSIFTSAYSEKQWAHQISKNFDDKPAIDNRNITVSIFSVPKTISDFKPEAYLPQVIALGPYHHFTPELYQMERYKVDTVRSFLNFHQIVDFQKRLIEPLKQMEPTIRACYHKYLDIDENTLAWIIAIDGLFLLDLLRSYSDDFAGKKMTQNSTVCRDMVIMENQFPMILLKIIRKTLQLVVVNENNYDSELYKMLRDFCVTHSPLPLARNKSELTPGTKIVHLHLLDLMYYLIANTRAVKVDSEESPPKKADLLVEVEMVEMEKEIQDTILNVSEIVDVVLSSGIGGEALKPLQVINNLPWEKMSNLLGHKTVDKLDNINIPIVEKISVPSVTYLSNIAGVEFKPTGGIRDVRFDEKKGILYLPVITVNDNTEVMLRNLVAYEATISNSGLVLGDYMDLMGGIIDTAEDVTMLITKGIIKGELADEKIADFFNGMNKSSRKVGNTTMEKINEYFNKKPRVKMHRFWRKNVYESWKALTFLSTIFLLLLLILQSFCDVYGCQRFFGSSN